MSSTEDSEDAEQYAVKLSTRVKSFDIAPLHPTAYMGYLARYLMRPFRKQQQNQSPLRYRPKARIFVNRYALIPGRFPKISSFTHPDSFKASGIPKESEIVFLQGRPSAEWLNEIGHLYSVDHRFFHSHLADATANHTNWYAIPTLPSRTAGILKFRIPTIVQVGAPGRNLLVEQLESARHNCHEQVRKRFCTIQDSHAEPGQSIIRSVNIHNGSTLVMEQEMTATVVSQGDRWTVMVWTDAGDEDGTDHVPVPKTDGFLPVAKQLSFCPTFFENDLVDRQLQPACAQTRNLTCHQPLVLVGNQYGLTLDWSHHANSTPIFIIQELLNFEACAVLQYLNMLELLSAELMKRTQFPSYEHTKIETILHFDYLKEILSRWKSHLLELFAFVNNPPAEWCPSKTEPGSQKDHQTPHSDISIDLAYLIERVRTLLVSCEDSKATLMSNASVQEAKRSAYEASLVRGLTKATNRLTFIFLPISFLTSVFGMNFRQFGQGPLSIWIWVAIACPLLITSVVVVEKGSWIRDRVRQTRQRGR